MNNVYTVAEAARRLELGESTIRKYCAEGRLTATKFGKSWIIESLEVR